MVWDAARGSFQRRKSLNRSRDEEEKRLLSQTLQLIQSLEWGTKNFLQATAAEIEKETT